MKGTPKQILDYLYNQDKDKIFELKEYKPKRSLTQNAYAWELITKIGNVLRKSKEEIYMQMLKDYGQIEVIMIPEQADIKGYIKYYELESKRKVNDKIFCVYRIYKGSSEFDSKEMSIFIDGIVEEAKQLDIETLSPEKLKSMEVI